MSQPDYEPLLQTYQGKIVPRSFDAGFVTLSYIVSLIGSASTLELMNRRTSRNGLFNHVLLVGTAVAMGGIAVWCMHFIGNRAVFLANGQPELQIVYSSAFTALSFFVPILVLIGAFVAVGTPNEKQVMWWRIIGGGSLAGAAICGMHYLGNASIENYTCEYTLLHVVGAALIAVAVSIVSLSLFSVFRASWTNSRLRRGLCAVVLACAVSGMHWSASTGTQYRLLRLSSHGNQSSRNTTVIIVLCLSVAASLVLAATATYTARLMRRYALKAQQIVVAAAVFDPRGRILVNPDGLLPSELVTDSYIEKTTSDTFSIANSLFLWIFQASRDWAGLRHMIGDMRSHLAQRGLNAKGRLTDHDGQLIKDYDLIFRELFCVAAASLADKMKEDITNVGILWDNILPTGADVGQPWRSEDKEALGGSDDNACSLSLPSACDDKQFAEPGKIRRTREQEYGRGALMFLVRRLQSRRDVFKLEAAGFRFAHVSQVCAIIGNSMQIKTKNLGSMLMSMPNYADEDTTLLEPGIHLGFFGVKARVADFGFDLLVRRGARNLLPSVQLPLDELEPWHMDWLQELHRAGVAKVRQRLWAMEKASSSREKRFATQLRNAVENLSIWINDPIFNEAMLTSRVVQVPCRKQAASSTNNTCTMITLHVVVPIHAEISSTSCEFVPLNFFKVHQLVYKDSPQHAAFTRHVHRDLAPILHAVRAEVLPLDKGGRRSSLQLPNLVSCGRPSRSGYPSYPTVADGSRSRPAGGQMPRTQSTPSGAKWKIWTQPRGHLTTTSQYSQADGVGGQRPMDLGGIMVSQEITVDVRPAADVVVVGNQTCQAARSDHGIAGRRRSVDHLDLLSEECPREMAHDIHAGPARGTATVESRMAHEARTFVDELFVVCFQGR